MQKIKRVSMLFRILFQIIFIALPLLLTIFWIAAPNIIAIGSAKTGFAINFFPKNVVILYEMNIATKLLGFLICLIPMSIKLFTLYFLIKLFRLYENTEFFSLKNVKYIRNIGYALLIGQIIHPIYEGLLTATLTWHNPPGYRMASISLTGTNIGIILIAFVIILVSWIMAEGYKMQEEQQYTV